MARKVVDNTNYSFGNATDAFVVYADYSAGSGKITNPSATISEIYAAVHDQKRPCVMFLNGGADGIAYLQSVNAYIAKFSLITTGGVRVWYQYYNGVITKMSTSYYGTFIPETDVAVETAYIKQSDDVVSVYIMVDFSSSAVGSSKKTVVLGQIDGVSLPYYSLCVVARNNVSGTANTAFATVGDDGVVSVDVPGSQTSGRVILSCNYIK